MCQHQGNELLAFSLGVPISKNSKNLLLSLLTVIKKWGYTLPI